MNRCAICGKTIQDHDAKFGADCQARYEEALTIIETSDGEIAQLSNSTEIRVQRWLSKMSSALIAALKTSGGQRMKHLQCAKQFLYQARCGSERLATV